MIAQALPEVVHIHVDKVELSWLGLAEHFWLGGFEIAHCMTTQVATELCARNMGTEKSHCYRQQVSQWLHQDATQATHDCRPCVRSVGYGLRASTH